MNYIYTPEEARSIANALSKFLKSRGFTVNIDEALNDDAPCSTTLIAKRAELSILFEAQNQVSCEEHLKDLALWLNNHRFYAELFIATHRDMTFSGAFLKQLDQTGIGLILVEDSGSVKIERQPRNPALVVCPEPTFRFGIYKQDVKNILAQFNQYNSFLSADNPRKHALRDMCELVEGLTEEVALAASKKGFLNRSEERITNMKWIDQINALAAQDAYLGGQRPFVQEALKIDLHSFRGARNLVDHNVRSAREEARRQKQFAERMMMGPRLVADLVSIKSIIARKKKLGP
jgi:hypothetical protein